jgi:cytochrome c oxidase subunit IV
VAHAHTPSDTAGGHPAQHAGPSVRGYVTIGLILFVVTIVEIAASFMTSTLGLPQWVQIVTLLVLATFKGAMVLMFFMHLRFDSRWFTFLMTSGLILAVFGTVAMIVLFAYRAGYSG